MQNLSGKSRIIGKSIKVSQENPDPSMDDIVVGCCVIGEAPNPFKTEEAATN